MRPPTGRSFDAIRRRELGQLFRFFGLDVDPDRVASLRAAIEARFAIEVSELARLCGKLPERERFKLFREALRLSYESAVVRAGQPA